MTDDSPKEDVQLVSKDPVVLSIFEQARNEDLVLQLDDGTEFFIAAIDESGHEVATMLANEKLMTFLDRRAAQQATVPLDEVKRRLGLN